MNVAVPVDDAESMALLLVDSARALVASVPVPAVLEEVLEEELLAVLDQHEVCDDKVSALPVRRRRKWRQLNIYKLACHFKFPA